MQSRFHRSDIGIHDLCDFIELKALVFKKNQSLAPEIGQSRDHLSDDHGQLLVQALIRNRSRSILFLNIRMLVAVTFEGQISGNREEISSYVTASIVPALQFLQNR